MMLNLKRNWLVSSKLTWGIWQSLVRALENLKNVHFNGLLLNKVYNVWAKKVYVSYIWWHWILIQHLKENWLVLSKMTWGVIASFHQSTFESLKIWSGIDLSVQNWYEKFDKFWPKHLKISKICTSTGCFWPKYIMFELKKV